VNYAEGGEEETSDSGNLLKAMGFSFVSLAAPSQTKENGNAKVVSLLLNKDKITTIDDLEQVSKQLTDSNAKLTLQITGIKINKDAIGPFTTVSYACSGSLYSAIKVDSGASQVYKYNIKGRAKNSYSDPDSDTIQLTMKTGIYGDASVRKSGNGNYDTENAQAFEVNRGDSLDVRAALNVSSIRSMMERIRKFFCNSKNTVGDIPDVPFKDPAQSEFTFSLTAPDGLIFPTDAGAYQLDGSDAFDLKVDYPKVTMTLKPGYDNFKKLYNAIYNNTQNYIILTIKGVKVADDAPEWMTAIGTISGNFSAASEKDETLLDAQWKAVQDTNIEGGGDGTDYKDTKNDPSKIKLTIHVSKKPVPVTPENPQTPSPASLTTAPTNTVKVLGVSRPTNETVPVENMAQSPEPQKVLGAKRENHQIATGDDSQMMLYGLLALAAAAGVIIWLVRYRRRER